MITRPKKYWKEALREVQAEMNGPTSLVWPAARPSEPEQSVSYLGLLIGVLLLAPLLVGYYLTLYRTLTRG